MFFFSKIIFFESVKNAFLNLFSITLFLNPPRLGHSQSCIIYKNLKFFFSQFSVVT